MHAALINEKIKIMLIFHDLSYIIMKQTPEYTHSIYNTKFNTERLFNG